MFARLLVLFVVVPLVELYILFRVAELTSFSATVALVLFTGALGAWLAKRQGLSTLLKIQEEMAAGRLPGVALLDAAMILVAGALLLTPGILTDCFGFSLLFPPCRAIYRKLLLRVNWKVHWQVRGQGFPNAGEGPEDSNVVDGQATRKAHNVSGIGSTPSE